MTDDFGLLDEVYSMLCKNRELMALLGSPKTPSERNNKIRREITPLSFVTVENLNFMSIYLSSTTETDNIYVVRAFLNVDYYAKSREELAKIKRLVTETLREKDYFAGSMYSIPSETKGVYSYTQKFRPLIFA